MNTPNLFPTYQLFQLSHPVSTGFFWATHAKPPCKAIYPHAVCKAIYITFSRHAHCLTNLHQRPPNPFHIQLSLRMPMLWLSNNITVCVETTQGIRLQLS